MADAFARRLALLCLLIPLMPGIGRLVLNTRERICALEPRENCILLTSLRTHEDIVAIRDIDGITKLPKPDRRMLEIAEKIIEQQKGKFDPATFKDRYEDALRALLDGRLDAGFHVDGISQLMQFAVNDHSHHRRR